MEEIAVAKNTVNFLSGYIMCSHRKNTPRISVKVCEQNCRFKSECKEYRIFFNGQPVKSNATN